jgi:hypothetical protein
MLFARGGAQLLDADVQPAPLFAPGPELHGDVVGVVCPVGLGTEVLGRLARAVAAGAHFSIDRFSDLYSITDAIAQFAQRSAAGPTLSFAIAGQPRQIELTVGPFTSRPGGGTEVRDHVDALPKLVDELGFRPFGDDEVLAATIVDRRGAD